jgi:dihydroorotate dehydrogenase
MPVIDYYRIVGPILDLFPPEPSQRFVLALIRLGLLPPERPVHSAALRVCAAGLDVPNPLGLAAGFDKDAETHTHIFRLGFGFVEFGTVTPEPQDPNPGERLFRLQKDKAAINRFGFPSAGVGVVAKRLRRIRVGLSHSSQLVGANIGPNRSSSDWIVDYELCLGRLYDVADYFVANVSSPNTPALRQLQYGSDFARLADRLANARARMLKQRKPIFFKIAPDLSVAELQHIIHATSNAGIDGLVVGNTTLDRPATLKSVDKDKEGGLSGAPIFDASTRMLSLAYQESGGKLTLIGVGGIFSVDDLYTKIRAGASLCQIYTCLYYRGPHVVPTLLEGLQHRLARDGYKSVGEAVGTLVASDRPLPREGRSVGSDQAQSILARRRQAVA